MIKKLVAGLCLLCATAAFSQENNASPYSFYGIGDTKFKSTAENKSMGGIGSISDSIHINLQNPASYSQLKFTTFTVAASQAHTKLTTDTESGKASRTSLDYIALAFPFKKVGIAFGLMPYTSVGYRIQNTQVDSATGLTFQKKYDGSGGLNRTFAGFSYKITDKLSLGAEFNYYFGNIQTQSIVDIVDVDPTDDADPDGLQYRNKESNSTDYNAVAVNFGAYYQTLINKKYTWTASATFTPEAKLKGQTNRTIAIIPGGSSGSETPIDSETEVVNDNGNRMPMKIAGGTGFGITRKWFAGLEYTYTGNNVLANRYDGITNASFEAGHRFALGGYYIPKFYSFTSYLSRITYRAGLRYEKTGLVVNDQSINDYALTFGVGLPVGGIGGSNINIGTEIGKRGTKNAGLIQENYFNVYISLSLNDRWFVKRRFE
ncbi:hypothetical protein ACLI1A_01160 [Flavobacterium sp. RHBU_3]|uniref:hypothetical protein n=1 Tax=Flavobacterium sp. RHBU_3 TaxID=3391184 RepID=UPI00398474D1